MRDVVISIQASERHYTASQKSKALMVAAEHEVGRIGRVLLGELRTARRTTVRIVVRPHALFYIRFDHPVKQIKPPCLCVAEGPELQVTAPLAASSLDLARDFGLAPGYAQVHDCVGRQGDRRRAPGRFRDDDLSGFVALPLGAIVAVAHTH